MTNYLKKISLVYILLYLYGCSLESNHDELVKCYNQYVRTDVCNADSIIDYQINNGALKLKFHGMPDVKRWGVAVNTGDSYVCSVDNNAEIKLQNHDTRMLDDTANFHIFLMPLDSRIFFDDQFGEMLVFVYRSDVSNHKLIQNGPMKMVSINTRFYTDIKDTLLLGNFIDSINSRLPQRLNFARTGLPQWAKR